MTLSFTPTIASGSTNGLAILVTATASPGTIIHTVEATTTDSREELRMVVYNNGTASQPVTFEMGSTDVASQLGPTHVLSRTFGIALTIGPNNFSATTTIVRAFTTGTATEAIRIWAQVNRAT